MVGKLDVQMHSGVDSIITLCMFFLTLFHFHYAQLPSSVLPRSDHQYYSRTSISYIQ